MNKAIGRLKAALCALAAVFSLAAPALSDDSVHIKTGVIVRRDTDIPFKCTSAALSWRRLWERLTLSFTHAVWSLLTAKKRLSADFALTKECT